MIKVRWAQAEATDDHAHAEAATDVLAEAIAKVLPDAVGPVLRDHFDGWMQDTALESTLMVSEGGIEEDEKCIELTVCLGFSGGFIVFLAEDVLNEMANADAEPRLLRGLADQMAAAAQLLRARADRA